MISERSYNFCVINEPMVSQRVNGTADEANHTYNYNSNSNKNSEQIMMKKITRWKMKDYCTFTNTTESVRMTDLFSCCNRLFRVSLKISDFQLWCSSITRQPIRYIQPNGHPNGKEFLSYLIVLKKENGTVQQIMKNISNKILNTKREKKKN